MSFCVQNLFVDGLNHSEEEIKLRWDELNNTEFWNKLPSYVFFTIILLIGFVGNLLVCVVYSTKIKASKSKYLILTLSLFDILTNITALVADSCGLLLRLETYVIYSRIHCVMISLLFFNTTGSISTLFVIAVDRYNMLCREFKPQMTIYQTRIVIVFIIALNMITAWPVAFIFFQRVNTLNGLETVECFQGNIIYATMGDIYTIIVKVAIMFIGLILIVIYIKISVKIYKWAKKQRKRSNAGQELPLNDSKSMDGPKTGGFLSSLPPDTKTTIMLICVTGVFLLSFAPVVFRTDHWIKDCEQAGQVEFLSRFYYVNSVANPIIYSIFQCEFRNVLKFLLNRMCYCRFRLPVNP